MGLSLHFLPPRIVSRGITLHWDLREKLHSRIRFRQVTEVLSVHFGSERIICSKKFWRAETSCRERMAASSLQSLREWRRVDQSTSHFGCQCWEAVLMISYT